MTRSYLLNVLEMLELIDSLKSQNVSSIYCFVRRFIYYILFEM